MKNRLHLIYEKSMKNDLRYKSLICYVTHVSIGPMMFSYIYKVSPLFIFIHGTLKN